MLSIRDKLLETSSHHLLIRVLIVFASFFRSAAEANTSPSRYGGIGATNLPQPLFLLTACAHMLTLSNTR